MSSVSVIQRNKCEGFDFRGLGVVWGDTDKLTQINAKYALMVRVDCVPDLCRRFGLTFPELEIQRWQ